MLSRKTWFALAVAVLALAVWDSIQTQEIVYSERERDGIVYQSKVVCGNGFGMVFLGRYDPSLPGPATQGDCIRQGRTQVAEVVGLIAVGAALVYVGGRYGKEPPRPISTELPDLPKGERAVEGRRPRIKEG